MDAWWVEGGMHGGWKGGCLMGGRVDAWWVEGWMFNGWKSKFCRKFIENSVNGSEVLLKCPKRIFDWFGKSCENCKKNLQIILIKLHG